MLRAGARSVPLAAVERTPTSRSSPRPPARHRVARVAAAAATIALLLGWPAAPADATWSIIAIDPATGLVGGAMASCVPAAVLGEPDEALVPLVLVPGRAVGVVQGTIDPQAVPRFRRLLVDGVGAEDSVAALLVDDDLAALRQYAAVSRPAAAGGGDEAEVAAVTGSEVEPAAATATGDLVSAQGVLLADGAAAERALTAYVEARAAGRSLDRALADALLAGSRAGGDRRCDDDQTALFAHLAVAEPDDDGLRPSLLLTVTVDEGDGQNPVVLLGRALDEGRTGWVDAGLGDPVGVPGVVVLGVGVALAAASLVVIRWGMGTPSARRRSAGR